MTSEGDERTLTVAADDKCIDYQLPLAVSEGAVHHASQLLMPVTPPSRPRR